MFGHYQMLYASVCSKNAYMHVTFMKVELEIHVDGGGGIAGEEVARLAHQWTWKHGKKVQNHQYGGSLIDNLIRGCLWLKRTMVS